MKLPIVFLRLKSSSMMPDMEQELTKWFIITAGLLEPLGGDKRHFVRQCIKSQIMTMLSWEKYIERAKYTELKASVTVDNIKFKIVIQIEEEGI